MDTVKQYLIDSTAWPERAKTDEISLVARILREASGYTMTQREAINAARRTIER